MYIFKYIRNVQWFIFHSLTRSSVFAVSRVNRFLFFYFLRYIYFVLEALMGGEIFTHLRKKGMFEEVHAKFYAATVLCALQHMHDRCIVYRDLKPENLVLDDKVKKRKALCRGGRNLFRISSFSDNSTALQEHYFRSRCSSSKHEKIVAQNLRIGGFV